MKIAILGAGAFGTALGMVLAEKGYDIDYYDTQFEKERLKDVVSDAAYILLAVPSKAAPYVLPHLPKDKPLIVATKGLLSVTYFDDFCDTMVMSGPGFADDIKAHKETCLTATDMRIVELFSTDYLYFEYTTDKKGVLMCGALKNVYAVLSGMLGLERGTAMWQNYIREVSGEMREILKLNGADPETVQLECGLGDLKLTCGLPSRNYEFGLGVRNTGKIKPAKTVEGLSTLKRIMRGEILVPDTAVKLKELMRLMREWSKNEAK